jgi:hypothetical protein
MIHKIDASYKLATVVQAQLRCSKEAWKKRQYVEARKYLDMAKQTTEQLRREVNAQ